METIGRYFDREVEYAGVFGQNIEIETANPVNYYQAINAPEECEQVTIDGKLFLTKDTQATPLVIVIP